jgi:hypothetical protein
MSGFVTINLRVDGFTELPRAEIDEEIIAEWIEDRLNDGRNEFIKAMGRKGNGPSAPGEYPKTDGGRLANSVDYQMEGTREGVLGSDVIYALYLTTGTTSKNGKQKMAPRKMFVEALDDALKRRPETDKLAKAASFKLGVPGVRSIT